MDDYSLNLYSLNDSLTSGTHDLNSNSNLNSASSLSWAEDEVENYATFKVQHCLEDLEEYLLTGRPSGDRCFDAEEADQWRGLIFDFKLQDLLKNSRKIVDKEKLQSHLVCDIKRELEIHGHSSLVHSPTTKFGSPIIVYSQYQTPRVRSAYPNKSSAQPTRIRSAYPLKSPALPGNSAGITRTGTRSGHANFRSSTSTSFKNADYLKMVEDTSRLSIQANKIGSPSKTYTQLKRMKLLPPSLPKFEEKVIPEVITVLPPLAESSPVIRSTANNNKIKTGRNQSNQSQPAKLRPASHMNLHRKPASPVQRTIPPLSKPGQQQQYYRQLYNMPPPTTSRTGSRSDIEVSIVGTSLNLFDPIVRPVRPVPKLRNT